MVLLNEFKDRLGNQLQVGDLVVIHQRGPMNGKSGGIFKIEHRPSLSYVYVDIGEILYGEPTDDWFEDDREAFENDPEDFILTYSWDILPAHTGVYVSVNNVEFIGPVEILGDNDDDCI